MELKSLQTDIIAAEISMERGLDVDYSTLHTSSIINFASADLLKKALDARPEGVDDMSAMDCKPLIYALGLGKVDHALVLAGYENDFEQKERFGHTPVQYLAKYSFKNAIEPHVAMGPENTTDPDKMAINSEIFFNKCMKILRLIAPKSDLSSYTSYNYTALHCAAEENNEDAIEILADSGADLNQKNNDESTPLTVAVDKKKDRAVKMLLKKGANPDLTDKYATVLHEAVRTENKKYVKLLCKYNASKEIKAIQKYSEVNKGDTALTLADRLGNKEIIDLLKS